MTKAAPEPVDRGAGDLSHRATVSIWTKDFTLVWRELERLRRKGVGDLWAYFRDHPRQARDLARRVAVIDVNSATLALFGAGSREAFLDSLDSVLTGSAIDGVLRELGAIWEGRDSCSYEAAYKTLDGRDLWVTVAMAVPTAPADLGRVQVSLLDMTWARDMEDALREGEERYRNLVDFSPIPIVVHAEEKIVFINEAAIKGLDGTTARDFLGRSIWECIHPDFVPAIRSRVAQMYAKTAPAEVLEQKLVTRKGRVIDVEVMGTSVDFAGSPAGQVVFHDITERKRAERTLRQSEEQFRQIVEKSPVPIVVTDYAGNIEQFNEKFVRLFGWTTGDMHTPDDWWRHAYPDPAYRERVRRLWDRALTRAIADGTETAPQQWKLTCKNGDRRDVEFRMVPLANDCVAICLNDRTDRVRAEEELRRFAATDALTETLNRRAFIERAGGEIKRSERRGYALSFLLIDLDHFKQINDRHGHAAGDDVLRSFAALAKGAMRVNDVIGRMGGEEFAVLLPDADKEAAMVLAERLRARVARERIPSGGVVLGLTVSIGLAELGADGKTLDQILLSADRALYAAKAAGRNRVVAVQPHGFGRRP